MTPRSDTRRATPRTLAELGERPFLRELRAGANTATGSALLLGIGDDAALLSGGALRRGLLVTADALVEGVHFRRAWTPPADLGRKALAVNVSDLAAMGARPVAAFLTLSLPGETALAELRAFFRGLRAACAEWGCPLAGGDMTRGPHWSISITALGTPAVRRRVLRRDAARPGDFVYVTGRPGESAAGLEALRRGLRAPALVRAHNRPTPRLAEAALLAALPRVALLDVSDGIVNDASQLCEASGVAIELNAGAQLPLSPALRRFAAEPRPESAARSALDYFLFGGEDYELLFTTAAPPAELQRRFKTAGLKTPLHAIGRVIKGQGVYAQSIRLDGTQQDKTFRHF